MMTFSSFRLLLLPSLTSISRQSISILGGCWHTLHSSCPLMVPCRTPHPLFMNLVTHRHRNTPEPHPLVHISETNAREIMKFEKKPNDDISKQLFVLWWWWPAPPILLWIHLHWELGADITLKVSAPSIAGIASLATYSLRPSSFQPSSPFSSFTAASSQRRWKLGQIVSEFSFFPAEPLY